MTHIEWQPIKTYPAGARKTYLLTDGKTWGIGSSGWFHSADFETRGIRYTHWADIGELPK